jgi:hypothetical protein
LNRRPSQASHDISRSGSLVCSPGERAGHLSAPSLGSRQRTPAMGNRPGARPIDTSLHRCPYSFHRRSTSGPHSGCSDSHRNGPPFSSLSLGCFIGSFSGEPSRRRMTKGCEMEELNGLWSLEFFTGGVSRTSGSVVFTPQAKIRGKDSQFLWTGSYQSQGSEIWIHLEAATLSGSFANPNVSGQYPMGFTLDRLVGLIPTVPVKIGTSFSVNDSGDSRVKIVFTKAP